MSDTARPDVPPPRYEGEGHHALVKDEQEWLARPAIWGLQMLPAEQRWRKSRLYECHVRDRMIEFICCDLCRGRIADLFDEDMPFVDGVDFDIKSWYAATHPEEMGKCDGWQVLKPGILFQRGIICPSEARNKVLDNLFDVSQDLPHTTDGIAKRTVIRAWESMLSIELIGPNPFRSVVFDPSWRTPTAVDIARGMYESRDFSAMPILADALQDAGCDNDDVLNHSRDPNGVHVRGCWVVDGVLGKS